MSATPTVLNPGHLDRVVVHTHVRGLPVIRKQYRDDAGACVHDAMVALWSSPFGAGRPCPGLPQPFGYDAATRTLDMAVLDGDPLGIRGSVGRLPDLLDGVASLLADLHASGVVVARQRDPGKLIRSLDRKLVGAEPGLLAHLVAMAPRSETLCTNHGDFSPRNVLLTRAGPALIDFDRVQMAGPGRDVNYLAAWCWVTSTLNATSPRGSAWKLGDRFESAYLARRPRAAADLVAGRAFHRASGLVRIATEWSSMKSDASAARLVLDEAWRIANWGV